MVSSRPARWRKKDGGEEEGLLQTIGGTEGRAPLSLYGSLGAQDNQAPPTPPQPPGSRACARRSLAPSCRRAALSPWQPRRDCGRAWLGADGAGRAAPVQRKLRLRRRRRPLETTAVGSGARRVRLPSASSQKFFDAVGVQWTPSLAMDSQKVSGGGGRWVARPGGGWAGRPGPGGQWAVGALGRPGRAGLRPRRAKQLGTLLGSKAAPAGVQGPRRVTRIASALQGPWLLRGCREPPHFPIIFCNDLGPL